jgi:hypothetical protein
MHLSAQDMQSCMIRTNECKGFKYLYENLEGGDRDVFEGTNPDFTWENLKCRTFSVRKSGGQTRHNTSASTCIKLSIFELHNDHKVCHIQECDVVQSCTYLQAYTVSSHRIR